MQLSDAATRFYWLSSLRATELIISGMEIKGQMSVGDRMSVECVLEQMQFTVTPRGNRFRILDCRFANRSAPDDARN